MVITINLMDVVCYLNGIWIYDLRLIGEIKPGLDSESESLIYWGFAICSAFVDSCEGNLKYCQYNSSQGLWMDVEKLQKILVLSSSELVMGGPPTTMARLGYYKRFWTAINIIAIKLNDVNKPSYTRGISFIPLGFNKQLRSNSWSTDCRGCNSRWSEDCSGHGCRK